MGCENIKTLNKTKKKRKSVFAKMKEQLSLQVMALMGILWLIIFCYLPMPGIYMAFSDFRLGSGMFEAPFAGLKYFREFVTDPNIPRAIINTLGISALNITLGFSSPIIFALLLNEIANTKFKKTIQTISYLPHFISWVVLGGFMISWFSESGLLNEVLMGLGITSRPIYLLGDAKYFWWVAALSSIWKSLGWGAIIYLAAIAGINPELYESAALDGANRFRRIWHVTLPTIKPTIAILFIFAVSGLLNSNFEQIFVLRNSLNAPTSTVLDIYTYRVGLQLARFSYATAVGLIKSVIALFLLIMANKASDKLTGSSFF